MSLKSAPKYFFAGACPAVKYIDGYYYVIFAGAPFVYLVRTRDFLTCVSFHQQPYPR